MKRFSINLLYEKLRFFMNAKIQNWYSWRRDIWFRFRCEFSRHAGEHAFELIRQKDIQASERHNDSATQTLSSSLVVVCSFVTSRCCRKIGPPGIWGKKKKIKAGEKGAKRDAKHKSCEEEGGNNERAKDLSRVCSVSLEFVRSLIRQRRGFRWKRPLFVPYVSCLARGKKKEDEGETEIPGLAPERDRAGRLRVGETDLTPPRNFGQKYQQLLQDAN